MIIVRTNFSEFSYSEPEDDTLTYAEWLGRLLYLEEMPPMKVGGVIRQRHADRWECPFCGSPLLGKQGEYIPVCWKCCWNGIRESETIKKGKR